MPSAWTWSTGTRHARHSAHKPARYRRRVEIGEGTHMVLLEKNRLQAFDAINQFLSEQYEHD
ncbi:hypothetical protein BST65_06320 [Bradyrhizobium canariense]|nr:hypothetical protein BST65_06320 [Bradyrhizobium canariense]OSI35123.1 hypothetical protein BST66_08770 [Bradyrhizobium canariense]OSI47222.1 hypothetical protein BSZ20_09620 [Bradyrhizobium canariense]OSI54341.1 hypothetical protein BST67_07340 [Bradyrhizobium canariense]OSI57936.1 hypothetical protein BSZ15_11770 [Bradyrhizobium canariense]